ncbi:MAG TPA: hypothetical protein VM509_02870 [Planctomycetota bacterium]|nr:hypothetical protein [Planctomycetota bacterium]
MTSRLDVDGQDLALALSGALAAHVEGGVEVAVRDGALELRLRGVRLPPAGRIPLPKLSELRVRFVSEKAPSAEHVAVAWQWSASHVPAFVMQGLKEVASAFLRERLARIPAIAQAVVSVSSTVWILDPREIRVGAVRLGDVLAVEAVAIPGRDGAAVTITGRHGDR